MTRPIHVFIDESGDIAARPSAEPIRIVGGLLVEGDLTKAHNERWNDILRNVVEQQYHGLFPQDLHYGNRHTYISGNKKAKMVPAIFAQIKLDAESNDLRIHGIAIHHSQDIYRDSSKLLSEQCRDNRYLLMLCTLLEQVLFVDDYFGLTDQAIALHLHIASRKFVFTGTPLVANEMTALGYDVREGRRFGEYSVGGIVKERELLLYFKTMLLRWRKPMVELMEVSCPSIEYEDAASPSPAGLYLADLYLGHLRGCEEDRISGDQPAEAILHAICPMRYGPWLPQLAEMKLALNAGADDHFRELQAGLNRFSRSELGESQAILCKLEEKFWSGAIQKPDHLLKQLNETCLIADLPGRAKEGLDQIERFERVMNNAGIQDVRAEALLLQGRLSVANHTGDIAKADELWCKYEAIAPQIAKLGMIGLKTDIEMKNRRGVSLTDHYRLEDARKVLSQTIDYQELILESIAENFGLKTGADTTAGPEYAACLGTLGQVETHLGNYSAAEGYFRKAAEIFSLLGKTWAVDEQRQWVYLGHVACDNALRWNGQTFPISKLDEFHQHPKYVSPEAASLWEEVLEQLGELKSGIPISCPGGQYMLALQLKGMFCFGAGEDILKFLDEWKRNDPISSYPEKQRSVHPFGLIHQSLGLLNERIVWENPSGPRRKTALKDGPDAFRQAFALMANGGPLLRVLAWGAKLREHIWNLESGGVERRPAEETIGHTFQKLRAMFINQIGPAAWHEQDNGLSGGVIGRLDPGSQLCWSLRARNVLTGIHFNYW